jgi:DNA-binding MarR family transcriptional regulator
VSRKPDSPSGLAERVGKRTPFPSLEQEAYLNLLRTHARLAAPIDRLLKTHGISQPLYNILRILRGHRLRDERAGRDHPGLPVLRIGRDMVAREPDTTRLITRLERLGLVTRVRCERDRRIVYVRVTDKGLGLIDHLRGEIDRIHAAQFEGLSRDELETLNDLLFKAAEHHHRS